MLAVGFALLSVAFTTIYTPYCDMIGYLSTHIVMIERHFLSQYLSMQANELLEGAFGKEKK